MSDYPIESIYEAQAALLAIERFLQDGDLPRKKAAAFVRLAYLETKE